LAREEKTEVVRAGKKMGCEGQSESETSLRKINSSRCHLVGVERAALSVGIIKAKRDSTTLGRERDLRLT